MKQAILCLTCMFMLVAVALCTGSFTCGTGSCPSGTGCCVWSPPGSSAINQCYDTNTFSCVNDQSISNEKCLCIQGQSCCNKACYNPSTFQCTQNFGNNGPTCLCTPGQSCCNGQCFDPNIFFCVLADNKPGKRCLCQVGAHTNCYFNYETGHQTCYNDNTQTVCPNGNIVYTNQIATVTITQSGGSNTCGGGPVTLTCSATGNQGPYSYSWTTSNGGTIGGATNVAQITALTSGDYKCTAVGVDNCPVSKTKTVTISTSTISATITANPSPSTCGQPVTLTCNPQGATNPVQYTWTTIGGNIPAGTQNSQSITVPVSGQYTCSIQDANGCTATASQQVTITNLQAQVSPTSASSCNAPIQFTCTPIGVTPVPPTFTWVASEGGVITGPSNTPQITASLPGKYTCIVNSGPCMATAFGTITQGNCVCTNFRVFIDPQYGSTENTGSKAILDFAFAQSGANTVLTLTIINNSGPVQSTLVGVAFDLPNNLQISAYNDLGTSFTTLWTNPDLPPYGTFDTGISPPRMSFAGGNPQSGIDTGAQITVQFTFNNLNANTLAQDFFNGFSSGALRSVGRFQRVNGEGSDKVLGGGVVCV